ncbi:hypothetical protein CsSME_00020822 [Camellia sinensis var. sinensis]
MRVIKQRSARAPESPLEREITHLSTFAGDQNCWNRGFSARARVCPLGRTGNLECIVITNFSEKHNSGWIHI